MKFRSLHQLLAPLKNSPFHPQWLIFRNELASEQEIGRLASGITLDIGAGRQDIRKQLPDTVDYIALDYYDTAVNWYESRPNIFGDGQYLPIASSSVDTVLLLDVMEHLPQPQQCVADIWRVLKPGGTAIIQVPFLYPLHDVPLDFHRWTLFGLRQLAKTFNFSVLSEHIMGSPVETAVLLNNLAFSKIILQWAKRKNPLALLGVMLPFAVLTGNLYAWIMSKISPDSAGFMPQSYRVHWKKPA